MSDTSPQPAPTPPPSTGGGFNLLRMLVIAAVLVAIAGIVYWIVVSQNKPTPPSGPTSNMAEFLRYQGQYIKLDDAYTDADGDLIADTPTEADKVLDPQTLVFSAIGTDNPAVAEVRWGGLMAALGKATGKKVVYLVKPPAENAAEDAERRAVDSKGQLAALKEGQLHVTAFNTGMVRRAVNKSGFVPMFCPADEAGEYGYTMKVIVPADSAVTDLAGLKGKQIGFTAMSSNSGAKAPIVILNDNGLLLDRDYTYAFSGGHINSIYGVCLGKQAVLRVDSNNEEKVVRELEADLPGEKWDAACVASDILDREVESGRLKAERFKTIFTSEKYPPICFGVSHNLEPGLREKIEKVFAEFQIESPTSNFKKFVRIDYKKDWQTVRDSDAKLGKLLDK